MDLSKIKAIYTKANKLRDLINSALDRIYIVLILK